MRRQPSTTRPLPQTAVIPTGNVNVLPRPRTGSHDASASGSETVGDVTATHACWTIRDGEGLAIGPAYDTRPEALREMSLLAFRGASLPLALYGPDGLPTGDRLA